MGTLREKSRDFGLLVLRVGLGLSFLFIHGGPKMLSGPDGWVMISAMGMKGVGITAFPAFLGFMAAASEFIGAILLILGVFMRPACFFMAATMAVATHYHLARGDSFEVASHAIEMGIVFVSLMLIGPGRYSLTPKWKQASKE